MWRVICIVLIRMLGFRRLVATLSGVSDSNNKIDSIKTSNQIMIVSML